MANNAKNNATGKIPMTVKAMFFAFSHSAFPLEFTGGHDMASLTSENIKIPIKRATAAPINDRMNPRLSTIDRIQYGRLFKILNGLILKLILK